jgi:hypothetical protein
MEMAPRREGFHQGHRFRDRQILFDREEFDAIRSYASHVERVGGGGRQLRCCPERVQ